jgi:hypothetical protein
MAVSSYDLLSLVAVYWQKGWKELSITLLKPQSNPLSFSRQWSRAVGVVILVGHGTAHGSFRYRRYLTPEHLTGQKIILHVLHFGSKNKRVS